MNYTIKFLQLMRLRESKTGTVRYNYNLSIAQWFSANSATPR